MSIRNPVIGIHSDSYENNIVPEDTSDPLVPNYGPYYYSSKNTTYSSGLNELDKNIRNVYCQISIIKKYQIYSHVSRNMAGAEKQKYMLDNYGRILHEGITDLKPEEEAFLNESNKHVFKSMCKRFEMQLYYMKNKIGVFRDPIFPDSYPWAIPKFTFTHEESFDSKKPHLFVVNQEFRRGVTLNHNKYTDEMKFWQYKHYEEFHVNDPTVIWGPNDIAGHNLLFDDADKKIFFFDCEGFTKFNYTKVDKFRYKVMSIFNPNIGEYLPGKDCNTPHETIKNDCIMNNSAKIFFKRLFLYEKLMFNFQFIRQMDEDVLEKISGNNFNEIKKFFEERKIRFQNWFHHEGEKVMQMTDHYVKAPNLKGISRDKYPDLYIGPTGKGYI